MSPRSQEANQQIRQKSRETIMQAAVSLFAEQGYALTTIAQIAQGAGVSKGLLYNYFASKEDLLRAILTDIFTVFSEFISRHRQFPDTHSRFRYLIDMNFDELENNYEFWRLYFYVFMQPQVIEQFRKEFHNLYNELLKVFTDLLQELGVRNPEAEAVFLAGTLDGLQLHMLLYPDKIRPHFQNMKQIIIQRYLKEESHE